MKPTIDSENTLPDPRTDDVGKLLTAMTAYTTWTKKRRELIAQVDERMKSSRHVSFNSDNRLFLLTRVGQSLLYQVPQNKGGYLRPLRGCLVRLVCVGSGTRSWRSYIASVYEGDDNLANPR